MFPNLEAELKRKNIKRADLAQLLNCSVGTISEKMTGGSAFSFDAAVKIKKFIGVDIEQRCIDTTLNRIREVFTVAGSFSRTDGLAG